MNDRIVASVVWMSLLAIGCADAQPTSSSSETGSTSEGGSEASSSAELEGSSSESSDDGVDESGSSSGGMEELPQGEELWRTTVAAGYASAVIGTADGGAVVVGNDEQLEGRAVAVRVDAHGKVLWKRIFAPEAEFATYNDVAIGEDGAVWVAGFRGWMSALAPSRSMVLERLDDASGDLLWAEPGIALEGYVTPSHDLFAVLAVEGGVLVAGQDTDKDGVIHPMVRRYADDGTLLWSGSLPDEGRAHDLARVGDHVLVVGARFDSSDEQPLAPLAAVLDLEGAIVATPSLPAGRADLVLAVPVPELGALAIGQRYVEDGFSLDDDVGWMLAISADGDAGTPYPLPNGVGGAVVTAQGELVVGHHEDVVAFDFAGTQLWELEETVMFLANESDALALAADGNVLAAGGFDGMELAKVAPPS